MLFYTHVAYDGGKNLKEIGRGTVRYSKNTRMLGQISIDCSLDMSCYFPSSSFNSDERTFAYSLQAWKVAQTFVAYQLRRSEPVRIVNICMYVSISLPAERIQ